MKRSFNFKLNLVATAVLITTGVANAGVVNANGTGTEFNPYNMGIIGTSPSILAVTLNGTPGSSFSEYVNFTIPTLSTMTNPVSTYALNLGSFNLLGIAGLTIGVWNDTHLSEGTLHSKFSSESPANSISNLEAGQYYLDVSGNLGNSASVGKYSVALQTLPVQEPENYAMLLAGLGLVGLSARRRKKIRKL
ncbi:hypothetical protein W03_12530 [Nitrosomonas sp. PY1]|uniref:FxDxF family PEP-CTERM protein n=1 Tax=Nitrosomonas sp. PY1 TaxID=1803906 RepID=UPI001FC8002D|nr:FxDxF family PEP-CTERM protein [Nitrosomonas sp. PY1]GKS69249.1 hypothetical protein W03_12530 [Nitrosomonas sp. PY1]